MPGAEITRYASDRRGRTGAVVAGQLTASLGAAANALAQPIVVLPALLAAFTDDWYVIGLPLVLAGLLWPLASAATGALGRERPTLWAIAGNAIRLLMVIALAFVLDRSDAYGQDALVRALLLTYGIYVVGAAIAARGDGMVAAVTVPARGRRAFHAARLAWASLAAVAVGLVAAALLSGDAIALDDRFAVLFVVAAAFLTGAMFFQSTLRAPATARPAPATASTGSGGGRSVSAWVAFRVLIAVAALADPFLVVYALRDLDASAAVIGLYVAVLAGARLLSAPAWSAVSRLGRLRSGLQAVALLRVLAPALALTLPYLYDSALWTDRVSNPDARGWVFAAVFAVIGVAQGGQAQLAPRYTLGLAAGLGRRVWPLTNGIVALAALSPLLGAWVIGRWGFDEMLLAASGAAVLGVLVSGALSAPAGVPRRVAGSWALRRPAGQTALPGRRT